MRSTTSDHRTYKGLARDSVTDVAFLTMTNRLHPGSRLRPVPIDATGATAATLQRLLEQCPAADQ